MPGINTDTLIALDLETTGTNSSRDQIIEVGAVKFRGGDEIDTLSVLVNPKRKLSSFIVNLTGITQSNVDEAPSWSEVKPRVREFISDLPIVGHNVGFDASFLRSHGVYPGKLYDTMAMAEIALPAGPEYGLEKLSQRFGFMHDNPHRALSDAMATRDLFFYLLDIIEKFDRPVLEQLRIFGAVTGTPLSVLVGHILKTEQFVGLPDVQSLTGVDPKELSRRLRTKITVPSIEPSKCEESTTSISSEVMDIFGQGGSLGTTLKGFESRPEQLEMATAVAKAIENRENLLVEAGTGVGKSLAYLVPSVLHAIRTGSRIIVSTNTINLQEQLIHKDVEITEEALIEYGKSFQQLRVSQLKGRANYLCFKRWHNALLSTEPNVDESRMLSKLLVWMQSTTTGDRAELALGRMTPMFTRYSAQGASMCPANEGPCFLRKARSQANTSNILIINHALLMSDVAMGGGLLPDHDVLVIDEAHHLESAATAHLGFSVNQFQLENDLQQFTGNQGILARLAKAISEGEVKALEASTSIALEGSEAVNQAIENASTMFKIVNEIAQSSSESNQPFAELRITSSVRTQPIWDQLEIAWENTNGKLLEVSGHLRTLCEHAAATTNSSTEVLILEANSLLETIESAVVFLREAIPEPDKESVYWLRVQSGGRGTNINGAPLDVSSQLGQSLFKEGKPVILTGAAVAYGQNFERYRKSIGMEGGSDLVLGSPYDYETNTLVIVPEDIPEPGSHGYANATTDALIDVARASAGRVLALFTSISALDNARKAITHLLNTSGIKVISQGYDGSPARIMRMLAENEPAIALGTSSLWEGVDLGGASLDALVMARLPFPVPTDPIVAARSEQFEDGFSDYSIPEAVQRFRQGFGRLIRSRTDRGAFVILDKRIITKNYGVKFQRSLPECTVRRISAERLFPLLESWQNGTFM